MRPTHRLLLVLALTIVALAGCVGSVGVSIPIGGGYGGPYGSVSIGSGPMYW